MKFAFIAEHLTDYPVQLCCRVLAVSRAGYYAWKKRPVSPRQQRQETLAVQIRAVHERNRKVYGSPRVYQVLKAQGEKVCENTVAKVMKKRQIRGKTKRKFVPRTTDSRHRQPVAANVLDRQFSATRPNEKWVTDITYIPTAEGWLYLAGVLDLC